MMTKILNSSKRKKQQTITKSGYNPWLLHKIQPIGNVFLGDPKYVKTGSGVSTCLEIHDVPASVYDFWLTQITGIDGVVSIVDVSTADRDRVSDLLDKSLLELDCRYRDEYTESEKIQTETDYHLMKNLMNEITVSGELIKNVRCRLWVSGFTTAEVDEKVKQIQTILARSDFHASVYFGEMEYQYRSILTPASVHAKMKNKSRREGIPMSTTSLAGGYPFNDEFLDDPYGFYIGNSMTGGNVIFDPFAKTNQRNSYDGIIVGKKGSGKSTLLKTLLKNVVIAGNYARAIDIVGEFTALAKKLNGTVITLDGSDGIINFLEVFAISDNEKVNFTSHISKLSVLYSFLSPNAPDDERKEFEHYAKKLYEQYGLWDSTDENQKITGLDPSRYPIFSDFYDLIKSEMQKEDRSTRQFQRLDQIHITLRNLVSEFGHMFNGKTSIQNLSSEQLVVFNLQSVMELKAEIVSTVLFNVFSLMLGDMVHVGGKSKQMYEQNHCPWEDLPRLLLVIDEAHKILNAENSLALDHMITIVREARKFFTGLWFASQSIRDYAPEETDSAILGKLKTLFELTQYKFIMQQDSNTLPHIRNIFDGELSESQVQAIPRFSQGETIFSMSGVKSMLLKVSVTQAEIDLFAGGA